MSKGRVIVVQNEDKGVMSVWSNFRLFLAEVNKYKGLDPLTEKDYFRLNSQLVRKGMCEIDINGKSVFVKRFELK